MTPLGIRVSKSLVHNEYNDRKNNTHTTITSTAKTTIARTKLVSTMGNFCKRGHSQLFVVNVCRWHA